MPAYLQPKAAIAADAILVGDPGRALLLAQELLEQPKMCNHARGLWGYSGSAGGRELTVQSTGLGAPSAAAVLADLAELGVRRAIRIGTCAALSAAARLGELLLVAEAVATEGSAAAFGLAAGAAVTPDAALLEALARELPGDARMAAVASLDLAPAGPEPAPGVEAADMQTVGLLARGPALGVAVAAVLAVTEARPGCALEPARLEQAVKRAGDAARRVLSA